MARSRTRVPTTVVHHWNGPPAVESYPATGTHCSDCGEPQYETPSGASCRNGHGGAPPLEHTRATPLERVEVDVPPVEHAPPEPAKKRRGAAAKVRESLAAPGPVGDGTLFDPDPRRHLREEARTRVPKSLRFVGRMTRRLVEVHDVEAALADETGHVRGAFVKIAPTLKASERETFDGAALRAAFIDRGAVAVMIAPRIVSDGGVSSANKAEAARRTTPEESVREWFAGQVGLTDAERAAAIDLALEILESVR